LKKNWKLPVADYFLRADLAGDVGGDPENPDALLKWACSIADKAPLGDVYRSKEGRKTLRFERQGKSYFLKLHQGIGWGEVFKNLLQLRLPVLGASNEYRAINALRHLGVDTMSVAAYLSRGCNPAAIKSLIVTDDLVGTVSLEDYCADWADSPPKFATRLKLFLKVADSARRMHEGGINHRDFYICHFHLDLDTLCEPSPRCHLIDLHRAQMRPRVPRRWLVKDLAGLYFSAMDCGLSQRDLLRFIRHYSGRDLRRGLVQNADIWRQVARRAEHLYQREHGRPPPLMGKRPDAD
jgi:heptose I phosphotransferase